MDSKEHLPPPPPITEPAPSSDGNDPQSPVLSPLDVEDNSNSGSDPAGSNTPMEFEVIVFHRENEITVVAILPRGLASGAVDAAADAKLNSEDAEDPGQANSGSHLQRLMAILMGGVLSRMTSSREARAFWEAAFDTQVASRPLPTSQQALEALPTSHVQPLEVILSDRCTVCQENYQVGDKITCLPCDHKFHKDCVVSWLKHRNSCPLCRFKFETELENKVSRRVETEREEKKHEGKTEDRTHGPIVTWLETEGKSTPPVIQPHLLPSENSGRGSSSRVFPVLRSRPAGSRAPPQQGITPRTQSRPDDTRCCTIC
mmetsp:Transcript_25899/g.62389  ORF Transcript_25899/g.62389 Transcript_25899/m.62389 type:complete len:316 (-) Transcript_25899:371-1318(-)